MLGNMEKKEYCDECKKLKAECTCKKEETKECTDSGSSGAVEVPYGMPIMKRDIHKFHNFKSPKTKELSEMEGAGISAGAMYDGPIGHGKVSPMDKKNKPHDPMKIDKPRTASITAAPTKDMKAKQKGFPKFGGPEGKYVEIDEKCKRFPYCNQGDYDPKKFTFVNEIKGMKEAIQEASKKYGIPINEIKKMVAEALPVGIDFGPASTWGKSGKEEPKYVYHLVTIDRETKQPIPLKFATKKKDEFDKLKALLLGNGTQFTENKHPIESMDAPKVHEPPKDEDIYGSENDPDFGDNIFDTMKK
jgi:hypothetical protein